MLVSLMKLESRIEVFRQELALHETFSLNNLFHFLDIKEQNMLTEENFDNFLVLIESRVTNSEDSKQMFERLDLNQDNNLRYDEFCRLILPLDKKHQELLLKKSQRLLPMKTRSRNRYEFNRIFDENEISCLKRIFDGQVEWQRMVNRIRSQLNLTRSELEEVFEEIVAHSNIEELIDHYEVSSIEEVRRLLTKLVENIHGIEWSHHQR